MAPKKAKAVAHSSISRHGVARNADIGIKKGLAMSTTKPKASPRAKAPRKVAANQKWSEERLLTSDKSVLIDMDLVKLMSHPQAWNCLEESEKREILALLPADVHPEAQTIPDNPGAKIPPIPENFLRYSNNWRDGVRQFQLDLENGRYDPEWLRLAQEARERREKGEFDSFKEREYEQFWGQKQKVFNAALAGESARVRLGTLITEAVIQLGDIWRFYFVFGRGPDRIVIEKEVRIDGIDGVKLTFVVPPGERVFLRSEFNKDRKYTIHEKKVEDVKIDPPKGRNAKHTISAPEPQPIVKRRRGRPRKDPLPELIPNAEVHPEPVLLNGDQPSPERKKGRGRPRKNPLPEPGPQAAVHPEPVLLNHDHPTPEHSVPSVCTAGEKSVKNGKAGVGAPVPEPANPELHSRQSSPSCPEIPEDNQNPGNISIGLSSKLPGRADNDGSNIPTEETSEVQPDENSTSKIAKQQTTEEPASSQDTTNFITNELGEIILSNITTPHSLVMKILQIDGRRPNGRTANAWKEFRCYRNNQDMGSLFDVRETWFLQHE